MLKRRINRKNFHREAGLYKHADLDCGAYLQLGNIRNGLEIKTTTDLTTRFKTLGLWDKAACIYPISPTGISAAVICLKTRTIGQANNSPTHSSSGVLFNGTTSNINTKILHNTTNFPNSVTGISYYTNSHTVAINANYAGITTVNKNFRMTLPNLASAKFYLGTFNVDGAQSTTVNGTKGLMNVHMPTTGSTAAAFNGTIEATSSPSITASFSDLEFYFGGRWNGVTFGFGVAAQIRYGALWKGALTAGDVTAEYAAVLLYEQALGRS